MKTRLFFIIILAGGLTFCGYLYYHHNYLDTLMLSEIVGHTDNSGVNMIVSLADFDTGLTRHDISQLKKDKDYWFTRIQELDTIQNNDLKEQASLKLLADMMEDPVLNKICKGFVKFGSDISFGILELIL
jgi:hypothetical protein